MPIEVKEFSSHEEMMAYVNNPESDFNKNVAAYEAQVRAKAIERLNPEETVLYTKWMDRKYTPEELARCNSDKGELSNAILWSISMGFG
jgi:hypothetical protein